MGISRWTAMAIQANKIEVVNTGLVGERSEAWLMKNGQPHALLLSCSINDRPEMESLIEKLKAEVVDSQN